MNSTSRRRPDNRKSPGCGGTGQIGNNDNEQTLQAGPSKVNPACIIRWHVWSMLAVLAFRLEQICFNSGFLHCGHWLQSLKWELLQRADNDYPIHNRQETFPRHEL